jgi:uncharacterized protein
VKVVLAGGSGALGSRLAVALHDAGHEPVVLTRRVKGGGPFREVAWDGRRVGSWAQELDGSAVVNLAGQLVDRRPTADGIALLTSSRVEPTTALVAASHAVAHPPSVWLQLSTVAIYGDAGDAELGEESPLADSPPQMAGVARAWEGAVGGARTDRLLVLRTGVVLDRRTPAFDRLTWLARWGLGGRIGSGQQWISWIHGDDFRSALLWLLDRSSLHGVVHVTGPEPLRNVDFMAALRRALHRPIAPPTPTPLVRVGAVLMRTDPALALTGRRALPRRLAADGFPFTYSTLDAALGNLVGSLPPRT